MRHDPSEAPTVKMTCELCGTHNPDEAVFCGNCGQALAAAPRPVTETPAAPVADPPVYSVPTSACLVCGHVLATYELMCPRCGTARGTRIDPDAPVAASVDPVVPAIVSGNGSGTHGAVPDELRGGWNWGAFWLPLFWGLSHNTPQTLWVFALWGLATLVSIPVALVLPGGNTPGDAVSMLIAWPAGLALGIWFGRRGNEWAWRNRRFDSIMHFRHVQRVWTGWAIASIALFIGVVLVVGVMVASGQMHLNDLLQ